MAASDEALSIRRQLAEARPDAFLPDLAMTSSNRSEILLKLGALEEALAASDEAVSLYRNLAQAQPGAFSQTWPRRNNQASCLLSTPLEF